MLEKMEVEAVENRLKIASSLIEFLYFEKRLEGKFKELKKVNDQLRKENVKISKPISDDIFVQYDFSVKTNGGYKEGNLRYWKDAIKYKLNKRLN